MRKSSSRPLPPLGTTMEHHLIDHPKDGWSYIDITWLMAAGMKTRQIPEWVGLSLRSATVCVNVYDEKPFTLNHIELSIWKFDENGFADQTEPDILVFDPNIYGEEQSAELMLTNEDIDAIRRCVGLSGNYAPFPPVENRSARFFVDDIDTGWRHIGKHRRSDIQNGRVRVPRWAGRQFRSALAFVEVDGCKVVALNRIEISIWKIREDGYADQKEQMKRAAIYANIGDEPADHGESIATKADTKAIRRCLGLSYR